MDEFMTIKELKVRKVGEVLRGGQKHHLFVPADVDLEQETHEIIWLHESRITPESQNIIPEP